MFGAVQITDNTCPEMNNTPASLISYPLEMSHLCIWHKGCALPVTHAFPYVKPLPEHGLAQPPEGPLLYLY